MTQSISLKVPEELDHPLFFPEKETILEKERYAGWSETIPFEAFPYELLYYNNVEAVCSLDEGGNACKGTAGKMEGN